MEYELLDKLGEGAEGIVYETSNPDIAKKVLWSKTRMEDRLNKAQKLIYLKNIDEIRHIAAMPSELFFTHGVLQSFYMERIYGLTLDNFTGDYSSKLRLLKEIKDAVILFEKHKILYLDLRNKNILYDGCGIKFVDMDGAMINGLPSQVNNNYLNAYFTMGGSCTFNSIIYQLNLLTYQLITNKKYTTGFRYLLEKNYEDDLNSIGIKDKVVFKMVEDLFSERHNNSGDHDFLLDALPHHDSILIR